MFEPTDKLRIFGVPHAARALALDALLKQSNAPLIHVSTNDRDLASLREACQFFLPKVEVLHFPAWDCLPYDRSSPSDAAVAERIVTLARLANPSNKPVVVLTTANAITQRVPPASLIKSCAFAIRKGSDLDREALSHYLASHGYQRVSKVMEPGEYALRGSIIDLFVPGQELGYRIDLFGDEVETIRLFDPLTQRSEGTENELNLLPVSEVMLNDETIARFRNRYREAFGAVTKEDPLYESISESRVYAGMEHWLPLFYEHMDTLTSYLPDAKIVWDHLSHQALEDRYDLLEDYYEARLVALQAKQPGAYHPLKPDALYLSKQESAALAKEGYHLSPFKPPESAEHKADMDMRVAPNFAIERQKNDGSVWTELAQTVRDRDGACIFACNTTGSEDRMQAMLKEHGIQTQLLTNWHDVKKLSKGVSGICVLPCENGVVIGKEVIFSEQDILGERIIRTQKRKRKSEAFMAEAANFAEGELVVHSEHGIGRFEGLVTVDVNNIKSDCLKLIYADEARLFLPVENIELISRYGEGSDAMLDKLGSVSWQKRKAKMRNRMKVAAEELLKIAAKRAMNKAPVLEPNTGLYAEFCQRFPYTETEDQMTAITDVLQDLAAGTPMDRLVCGDVGFGKTEVAMRAAFTAVTAERPVQVAIITPTTLLARQHYQAFTERFRDMPIRIAQLSRMVTTAQANETKELLKEGKVDIVIGTHALLGKQVEFKDLGLLIVDEEQHFGVAQKERLKKMRSSVHVLTLSATPIPRTLQLSLSGVRELSLITTPPIDRLAIRSFVAPFDSVVAREALMREYNRGGKSFVVTPRIEYMAELHARLKELVPEMKICAAHGQMTPKELDRVMNEFYDGKYDILLSTTIIESGIDIPTANTMIIDRADMFGLSQLYQLRGRVGRSKTRAYAYLTIPARKKLSPQAVKRLEVMQTLDSLGAGFTLASHDMDIRGYGNLLGDEQSGHVREVGVELYQHMLEEAIEAARTGREGFEIEEERDWSPQINLGTSVLIPETYVEDLNLRLALYRRAAGLQNEEDVQSFAAELVDRFGSMPEEVEHLLDVVRIKQLCKAAGVERIDTGPKGAVLTFRNNSFARPDKLLTWIAEKPAQYKFRADHKLVLLDEFRSVKDRMQRINQSIHTLSQLVA